MFQSQSFPISSWEELRHFRHVACAQRVRRLTHEMAQVHDMLMHGSDDPWADIRRRSMLRDPGFREIRARHMDRAAQLLDQIQEQCGDVLSPEELRECEPLCGVLERVRDYARADLIAIDGSLIEDAYARLMGAMGNVAAGMRDFLGVVTAGLGASAALLMEILRWQFTH